MPDDWQSVKNVRHRLRGSGSFLVVSRSEWTASPGGPLKCWPEFYVRVITVVYQGRSQKFVFGGYKSFFFWGGGIKLLNSRSDVIFTP